MVKKKGESGNDSYRLVVDYRKLNQNSEIQNFPIPLIDDILCGLGGSAYFTTLDIKGAFHQIVMDEDSRDYTAFTANNFQYRWVRMPMGLTSAPLTWQRAINLILEEIIGKGVYVYLDDVIVYPRISMIKPCEEYSNYCVRIIYNLKFRNAFFTQSNLSILVMS